jgi:hypothetical protein
MVGSLPALIVAGVALLLSLDVVSGAGTSMSLDPIEGYDGPIPFGNATINAPLDGDGKKTWIGMIAQSVLHILELTAAPTGFGFYPESFIPEMCAAVCTSTTNYNWKHPGANGDYMASRDVYETVFLCSC